MLTEGIKRFFFGNNARTDEEKDEDLSGSLERVF